MLLENHKWLASCENYSASWNSIAYGLTDQLHVLSNYTIILQQNMCQYVTKGNLTENYIG